MPSGRVGLDVGGETLAQPASSIGSRSSGRLSRDGFGVGIIEVIDQSGRTLLRKMINLSKGNQVIRFEINAHEGVYLLKLTNDKKSTSTKLFVK